ncbi:hypothetical protein [Sporomusa carbonis]|uniref:hypothetical protein n=1 Tax=Sporomusa carbonis TaxID=3076075 RepID=UPI003C7D062F
MAGGVSVCLGISTGDGWETAGDISVAGLDWGTSCRWDAVSGGGATGPCCCPSGSRLSPMIRMTAAAVLKAPEKHHLRADLSEGAVKGNADC